jgi:predicted DNA-binding protein YlxM (UPF0122 family)
MQTVDDLKRIGLTGKQIRVLTLYAGTEMTLQQIARRFRISDRIGVTRIVRRANAKLVAAGLGAVERPATIPPRPVPLMSFVEGD